MEKFNARRYRDQLAKDLKNIPNHIERKEALEEEKESFRYKEQVKQRFVEREKEIDDKTVELSKDALNGIKYFFTGDGPYKPPEGAVVSDGVFGSVVPFVCDNTINVREKKESEYFNFLEARKLIENAILFRLDSIRGKDYSSLIDNLETIAVSANHQFGNLGSNILQSSKIQSVVIDLIKPTDHSHSKSSLIHGLRAAGNFFDFPMEDSLLNEFKGYLTDKEIDKLKKGGPMVFWDLIEELEEETEKESEVNELKNKEGREREEEIKKSGLD